MKQIYKRLLLGVMAIIALTAVYAQNNSNPVTWRINYKMTSAMEGDAIVTAIISDGWHLYGTEVPKGGPKPTVIDFSGSTGIAFTGQLTPSVKATNYQDEMFDMKLQCWTKKVTFRRKFKVTDKTKAKLSATVSFMSCNNQNCSRPTEITLTKTIK